MSIKLHRSIGSTKSRSMRNTMSAALAGAMLMVFAVGCGDDGDGEDTPSRTCGDWETTTHATCEAEGERTRTCTAEPTTETQPIPMLSGAQCENGNGGEIGHDSRLITAEGQAWVGIVPDFCEEEEEGDICLADMETAYIFKSNGEMEVWVNLFDLMWMQMTEEAAWYTVGDKLYSVFQDEEDYVNFTVSSNGNTLTLIDPEDPENPVITLSKQPFNPSAATTDGSNDIDPALLNVTWVNEHRGTTRSWIFHGGAGTIRMAIYAEATTGGFEMNTYSWRVENGTLVLSSFGETRRLTYEIIDGGNAVIIDGVTYMNMGDPNEMAGEGMSKSRTPTIRLPELKTPRLFR